MLFAQGSTLTASMLRDIENGLRTEGDHVLGDLLARRRADKPAGAPLTLLELAYTHVKAYEARHGR
jgi:2-dehydropantoate 2-reductase